MRQRHTHSDRFRARVAVAGLPFLFLNAPVLGEETAELVTDRPDQTESSVVVPPGSVQVEAGWTFTRDDESGARLETHEAPGTLVRIGLVDRVELRVGWTGFVDAEVRTRRFEAGVDGIGDADLGAKVHLASERGSRPETALLVSTSVPVGDDAFTTDRFDPAVRLAFSHTLSERVGLGYNVGLLFESAPGEEGELDTLSTALYTVAVGFGLTDRLSAFVELFGDLPASAPGDPAHSFDGGFTYLVHDRLQLDVAAGVGLSDEADDWFVGIGVSARFDG